MRNMIKEFKTNRMVKKAAVKDAKRELDDAVNNLKNYIEFNCSKKCYAKKYNCITK